MSFVTHLFGRSDRGRSVIAAGTTLRGSVSGAVELVVAGTLQGDVTATAIIVAEGGRIDGDITADVLHIAGTVTGTCVTAALALAPTGALRGEVTYEKLEVAPGALLEARCHTRVAAARPLTRPMAVAAPVPMAKAATA
ncbi:bactofilin family protein [Novispirillum sp. DQ9]|uniref:bactofilin family protein n=1 Tax=Novispirillum sp. DQ9 TaxID=3398612 RepID=UPI003C7E97AA